MALSPDALQMLKKFMKAANTVDLNPFDQQRFRAFIIQAHKDGGPVLDSDVIDVLRQAGSRWKGRDSRLGADYFEGRQLLAEYDETLSEQ